MTHPKLGEVGMLPTVGSLILPSSFDEQLPHLAEPAVSNVYASRNPSAYLFTAYAVHGSHLRSTRKSVLARKVSQTSFLSVKNGSHLHGALRRVWLLSRPVVGNGGVRMFGDERVLHEGAQILVCKFPPAPPMTRPQGSSQSWSSPRTPVASRW